MRHRTAILARAINQRDQPADGQSPGSVGGFSSAGCGDYEISFRRNDTPVGLFAMDTALASQTTRPSFDELVAAYCEALDRGLAVDREAWIDRYPELAGELSEFFADQDLLIGLVDPLREAIKFARAGNAGRVRSDRGSRPDRGRPGKSTEPASTLHPDDRRLRAAPRPGPGRHGRRLQGPAGQPQPDRRPEDDPGRASSPPRPSVRRFQQRGRGRRPASTTRTSCRSTRSASTRAATTSA